MQVSPLGPVGPNWTPVDRQTPAAAGPTEQFQSGAPQPSLMGVAKALFKENAAERWRVKLPFSHKNNPTTDRDGQLYMASHDGQLQRIDPETGKASRRFENGQHMTDPTFTPDGGVLVVSNMRRLHVLDAQLQPLHEVPLDHSTLSPPVAGPNNLLVMLGGDGLTDKDWSIYAVDPNVKPKKSFLGTLLAPLALIPHHGTVHQWEVKVNARPGQLPIPMTPKGDLHKLVSLPTGTIAATTGEREVVAIDSQSGREVWRKELPSEGLYDPVAIGTDQVMVAGQDRLHFLDVRTGETQREQPIDGILFSQPTADKQGNVFFFTGLDQLHVVRRDGQSWTQKGDFDTELSPVQDDQNHLFVIKGGALYALNAETGEENYRLQCKGKISSPPALLKDGSLAVKVRMGSGLDEELVCLQNPAQAACHDEDQAPAIQESASWVRIGGVQVKRKQG